MEFITAKDAAGKWGITERIVRVYCSQGRIPDKNSLLEILKNYTFSNSGKEALEFSSLRTYSLDVLQRIYCSIVRNKNSGVGGV